MILTDDASLKEFMEELVKFAVKNDPGGASRGSEGGLQAGMNTYNTAGYK